MGQKSPPLPPEKSFQELEGQSVTKIDSIGWQFDLVLREKMASHLIEVYFYTL